MATAQVSLTNRKLHYARLQLQALQRYSAQSEPAISEASSSLEAAFHFLFQAYLSLLEEIAAAYRYKGDKITSLVQLKAALASREQESAELKEMESLLERPSWLQDILLFRDLSADPERRDELRLGGDGPDKNELSLVDLARDSDWATKLVTSIEQFSEMSGRFRESTLEW